MAKGIVYPNTKIRDRIAELLKTGLSEEEVCNEMGTCPSLVGQVKSVLGMRRLNIGLHFGILHRLMYSTDTHCDIADRFKVLRSTVDRTARIAKQAGFVFAERPKGR